MFFKRLRRQVENRPVSTRVINDAVAAAEWASRPRASAPLNVKQTPGGPLFGITPYWGRLAIANGNISARSGTTPGFGSVFIVNVELTFSGGVITGGTLTTSSIAIQVYYPSSKTMTSGNGIDSGMMCWVQQDQSGFYAVSPFECA